MADMGETELPSWLQTSLSVDEIGRIEAAVQAAEKRTSCEIVPMIVRRSTLTATGSRILFWICFGILGVGGALGFSLLGGLDEALLEHVLSTFGLWLTPELYFAFSVATEALVAFAAFGVAWVVAVLLSRSDRAHRLAFPASDLTFEAEHRAQVEFYSSDLRSTAGRNGVLLFVSMLERRAVILADLAVVNKLDRSVWATTLNQLLTAIGDGRMGDGFTQAIESMANLLAPVFPAQKDNRNELSDRLRIRE